MKSFILLMLSFSISTFAFGQSMIKKNLLHHKKTEIKYSMGQKKAGNEFIFNPFSELKYQMDSLSFYSWNRTNQEWNYSASFFYKYDKNKALTEIISNRYEEIVAIYYDIIEDPAGNCLHYIYHYGGPTGDSIKVEKIFSVDSKILNSITYKYDISFDDWIKRNMLEYSYSEDGMCTGFLDYDWVSDSSKWVPGDTKASYTYDNKNNLSLYTLLTQDESSNEWTPQFQIEYIYDTLGNPIEEINSRWRSSQNEWYLDEKYVYEYDSRKVDELILPPDFFLYPDNSSAINNKINGFIKYEFENGNWEVYSKGIYEYSEQQFTEINTINSKKEFSIYPNPAKDYIMVELQNFTNIGYVEIYDSNGRKMLTKKIFNTSKINLMELSSGFYFYSIYLNNTAYKGKLILK